MLSLSGCVWQPMSIYTGLTAIFRFEIPNTRQATPNRADERCLYSKLAYKNYIRCNLIKETKMENSGINKKHKGGRHPKADRATFRYSISLTAAENTKFLTLFEQSGMNVMAHFITACIFQKTITTVKFDKAAMDYHVKLTGLFGQFRAIGVNYNQVVKMLYSNFTEKKAAAALYKLEQQTIELAILGRKIVALTGEFEAKHLNK